MALHTHHRNVELFQSRECFEPFHDVEDGAGLTHGGPTSMPSPSSCSSPVEPGTAPQQHVQPGQPPIHNIPQIDGASIVLDKQADIQRIDKDCEAGTDIQLEPTFPTPIASSMFTTKTILNMRSSSPSS